MRSGMAVCWARRKGAVLGVALLWCALFGAPGALASTLTWSGEAPSSSPNWSDGGNWVGGSSPAPSSTVALSFPLLGVACDLFEPAEACYKSDEDVSGLTVESMSVSDGGEYEIEGSQPVALGSGGLTSQPEGTESGYGVLALPLTLSAAQTWHLAGSSRELLANHLFLLESEVTGTGAAWTIAGEKGVELAVDAQVDTGPIEVVGAQTSGPRDANAIVGLGGGGSLNAGDHQPVKLAHVFFFGTGGVGALSTEAATLVVGSGEGEPGRLEAASASFDAATGVEFEVHGTGDVAAGQLWAARRQRPSRTWLGFACAARAAI